MIYTETISSLDFIIKAWDKLDAANKTLRELKRNASSGSKQRLRIALIMAEIFTQEAAIRGCLDNLKHTHAKELRENILKDKSP